MHGSTKNNTVKYYQKFWCAMLAAVMLIGNMLYNGVPKNFTVYAATGDVAISAANFPDDNFRAWVSSTTNVPHADTTTVNGTGSNERGTITQAECEAKTTIDLSGKLNIANLTGIEYFTKLGSLDCSGNMLTNLDLSQNTDLNELLCGDNTLTSINISQNTKLKTLQCIDNKLTSLDVSKNTALETLDFNNNQITSIDLSKNTALTLLACYNNNLVNLDISNNKNLSDLECENNQLTSLDTSENQNLTGIICNNNKLTSLDVSKNTALETLYCDKNNLTSLNLGSNKANLSDMTCSGQTTTASVHKNVTNRNIKNIETGEITTEQVTNYQVYMSDLVASSDIGNVSLPDNSDWTYDEKSGIMTYGGSGVPTTLTYDYDTGIMLNDSEQFMDVTATLSLNLPTVTFYTNNGEDSFKGTIDSTTNKVSAPTDPTRTYFKFLGWYTSTDGGKTLSSNPFDFSTTITTDTNLYAKWMCWIEFPEVGAIVTANDGGMFSGYLDKGYTLHADLIGESSEDYSALHSQLVSATDSGLNNSEIFDIYFTDESDNRADAKDFGENIEVYMKKPDSWDFGSMKAFYITPESAMECALTDTEMSGTQYVHLTTTHFSDYAIVTTGAASLPTVSTTAVATGDNSLAGVFILCSILLCAGLTLLFLKKKKASCR